MKVLIIRFSSLGDVILTSSVFLPLKEAGIEIDLLTLKPWGEIFKNDSRLSKVVEVEKKEVKTLQGLKKLAKKLNENRYDYIFDLHNNLRSRILSLFLEARVFRYKKSSLLRRLMLIFKPFKSKWLFVPQLYAETFKKIGIEIKNPRPSIPLSQQEVSKIFPLIPQKPFIVIAPGAKWEGKRYPVKKFAEISRLLNKKGFSVAVVGGKEDYHLGEKISENSNAVNLCGKLTLRESLAVISQAKGAISNDSAVVHMARAVKTPVAVIFGPTHPAFGFAPAPDEGIVITKNLPCSPCSLHGKTECKRKECFNITPEVVVENLMKIVKP